MNELGNGLGVMVCECLSRKNMLYLECVDKNVTKLFIMENNVAVF